MLEFIASHDHRLMHKANHWNAPAWVRRWMLLATRGGDGWLWSAVAAFILLFGGAKRFAALSATALAAALGITVFLLLKRVAGRKRPCHYEAHCWARLLPPDQFSFPSGHSITAFAVTVPLSLLYPLLGPLLLFCAMSVAASRILLGLHFLSDVVAGSLVGGALGYWCLALIH